MNVSNTFLNQLTLSVHPASCDNEYWKFSIHCAKMYLLLAATLRTLLKVMIAFYLVGLSTSFCFVWIWYFLRLLAAKKYSGGKKNVWRNNKFRSYWLFLKNCFSTLTVQSTKAAQIQRCFLSVTCSTEKYECPLYYPVGTHSWVQTQTEVLSLTQHFEKVLAHVWHIQVRHMANMLRTLLTVHICLHLIDLQPCRISAFLHILQSDHIAITV